MGTERFLNNTEFLDGCEDEGEIALTLADAPEYSIHLRDGYFEQIFGDADPDDKSLRGFSRDFARLERSFSGEDYVIKNAREYYEDALGYTDVHFGGRAAECFDLVRGFLEYAALGGYKVLVQVF